MAPVRAFQRMHVNDVTSLGRGQGELGSGQSEAPGASPLLSWNDPMIPIRVALDTFPEELRPRAVESIERALSTWTYASEDGLRCTTLQFYLAGEGEGSDYVDYAPEILFHYNPVGWQSSTVQGVEIAHTKPNLANLSTGELDDGKIIFAGWLKWEVGETISEDAYDFESTLVHELGHIAGFGHSDATSGSVMLRTTSTGLGRRTLAPDDVNAVCRTYPNPEGSPPRRVLKPGDCAMSVTNRAPGPSGLVAMGLLALVGYLRRRR